MQPDCYMHLGDVNLELATLDWIQCLVSRRVPVLLHDDVLPLCLF